jgi:hypothetical protein
MYAQANPSVLMTFFGLPHPGPLNSYDKNLFEGLGTNFSSVWGFHSKVYSRSKKKCLHNYDSNSHFENADQVLKHVILRRPTSKFMVPFLFPPSSCSGYGKSLPQNDRHIRTSTL